MTKAELQEYIRVLYAIKKTGARRVTHNGKSVEFNSLSEIAAEIASAEAQLDRMTNRRRRVVMVDRRV